MDDIVNQLHEWADWYETDGGEMPVTDAALVHRNAAGTIEALRQRQRELFNRIHHLNEQLLDAQHMVQMLNNRLADFEDDCS